MSFPSTILAQTNDPKEIQKADLDLLDKINKLSAAIDSLTSSASGYATTAQLATKAPLPQTASGVGQVKTVTTSAGAAFSYPAGGTWMGWWSWANSTGTFFGFSGGVAAGGTVINSGTAGTIWYGVFWEIA